MPKGLTIYEKARLDRLGEWVCDLTGERAYHVGSSLAGRDFRDVDVRLMLDPDDFERIFGERRDWRDNGLLRLADMALTALACQMTGLPVDFKVEHRDSANELYANENRVPLGDFLSLHERHRRQAAAEAEA